MNNAALERLKAAYEAWDRTKGKSTRQWLDLMDENVHFFTLGGGVGGLPENPEASGRAHVKAYFDGLTQMLEMDYQHVEQFVADGDTIVAIIKMRWTVRGTDRHFVSPLIAIWDFKGDTAIRYREYYDTAAFAAIHAA